MVYIGHGNSSFHLLINTTKPNFGPDLTLVLGFFMFLLYTHFQNHYPWPYIR